MTERASNPARFAGKSVLITGGGGGVGRATAARFAAEGAAVILLDKRRRLAEEGADEIRAGGGDAYAFECDVSDETSVRDAVASAVEAVDALDIVHVNAATLSLGEIHEMSLSDWNLVIGVNLTGAFLTIRETLPGMLERGAGVYVTTGSIEAVGINARSPASASYPASKGGLIQLTRAVAVEYARRGIRANCVCPGAIKTAIMSHITEDFPNTPDRSQWRTGLSFEFPLPDPSEASDVAAAVTFLASDDARQITGSTLMVDGGWSAV
jgi:3-oxoacyl-[acyl-carrier protein] reductase